MNMNMDRDHQRPMHNYARSPSMPQSGHVNSIRSRYQETATSSSRSSQSTGKSNVDDSTIKALSSKSNEYISKWQLTAADPPTSPKQQQQRFTPNKDSPTWKRLQQQQHHRDFLSFDEDYVAATNDSTTSGSNSKVLTESIQHVVEGDHHRHHQHHHPKNIDLKVSNTVSTEDTIGYSSSSSSSSNGEDDRLILQDNDAEDADADADTLLGHALASSSSSSSSSSSTLNWTVLERLPEENEEGETVGSSTTDQARAGGTVCGGVERQHSEATLVVTNKKAPSGNNKTLERFVEKQQRQAQHQLQLARQRKQQRGGARGQQRQGGSGMIGIGSASSVGSSSSTTSSKSNKNGSILQHLHPCSSSDSTSSSLIYSLGDTVKSSSSNLMGDVHVVATNDNEEPTPRTIGTAATTITNNNNNNNNNLAKNEEVGMKSSVFIDQDTAKLEISFVDEDGDDGNGNVVEDAMRFMKMSNHHLGHVNDDAVGKAVLNVDKLIMNNGHQDEDDCSNEEDGNSKDYDMDESEEEGLRHADPTADLVASTLAECRLLLEMSPPPTPISNRYYTKQKQVMSMQKQQKQTQSASSVPLKSPPRQDHDAAHYHHHPPSPQEKQHQLSPPPRLEQHTPRQYQQLRRNPSSLTSLNNINNNNNNNNNHPTQNSLACSTVTSTSLTSLTKFLSCPTCTQEFQEDGSQHVPLHSFACDHIICHACVVSGGSDDRSAGYDVVGGHVSCPECGEANAFDLNRLVVSRAYLSLVKKMKMEVEGGAQSASTSFVASSKHAQLFVPSQICVPSPTANRGGGGRGSGSAALDDDVDDDRSREVMSLASRGGGSVTSSSNKSSSLSQRANKKLSRALTVDVGAAAKLDKIVLANNEFAVNFDQADACSQEEDNCGGQKQVDEEPVVVAESSKKEVVTLYSSLVEPTTPVSRAEYRFLQRREKLALSLEKVNRILERSKATKKEAVKSNNDMYQKVLEYDKEDVIDEEEMDFFQQIMPGANDAASAMTMPLPGNDEAEEDEMLMKGPVWDNAPSDGQSDRSNGMNRLKTKLRVDTGELSYSDSTPIAPPAAAVEPQEREDNTAMMPSTDDLNAVTNPLPVPSSQKAPELDGKDPFMDIFRMNHSFQVSDDNNNGPAPQMIQFGPSHFNTNMIPKSVSNESSLTSSDNKGDTLCLLAGNRTKTVNAVEKESKLLRSKIKDYRIKKPQRLSGGSSNDFREHQLRPVQQQCPQFLPSLNYSTMQESNNDLVGLINATGNDNFDPAWGEGTTTSKKKSKTLLMSTTSRMSSASSAAKRSIIRPRRSGGGQSVISSAAPPKLFKSLAQSFDDTFRPNNTQEWDAGFDKPEPSFSSQQENCNTNAQPAAFDRQQQGPTYDFSIHSCSMSPSSYEEQQQQNMSLVGSGSLVTHKPRGRFHKKILKKIRGGSSNSNTQKKGKGKPFGSVCV